jgi:curli biogenesis system outer membrane secretion channel CsgG
MSKVRRACVRGSAARHCTTTQKRRFSVLDGSLAPHRFAAAVLAAVLATTAAQAQSRPRIAVVAFENNTTSVIWGDRLGEAAADELTTQLVKTGEFTVVERARFDAIVAEQHAGMSGAIDPATAARVGKILGVQAVVLGSITKFTVEQRSGGFGPLSASYTEAESMLDLRVVDTNTAEVLVVAEGGGKTRFGGAAYRDINLQQTFQQGAAQEALRPSVEKAIAALVQQKAKIAVAAPAAAQVVGVREGAIYIDRGENVGLKVGQRLEVLRVVDVIKDASGNVLDEVTEKVAVLEITRVLSQSAICSVVEGSPKEGDRVRL